MASTLSAAKASSIASSSATVSTTASTVVGEGLLDRLVLGDGLETPRSVGGGSPRRPRRRRLDDVGGLGGGVVRLVGGGGVGQPVDLGGGRGLERGLVGGDLLDDRLDRLGRGLGLPRRRLVGSATPLGDSSTSTSSAAKASSIASSSATVSTTVDLVGGEGLLDRLVLGDGLDDRLDPRPRRPPRRLVLGDGLDDLVDLGRGELLADLGERGRERVVDPALGLLDRVGHRVAALRARPALRRAARRARPDAGRSGLDDRASRRLLGLLEAEAEAMALGVERDDLELERLALVDDVARVGDALVGQLADVDQALEAVADAHERAEVDELRDGAVDDVADLEVRDRGVPRVRLQAADRQADPATLVVDVDDLGLDLLADLVAGLGVVDLVPRELALVDEAVDAAEVDEDAERRDRADRAGDLLADLQAAEQLVPLLAALLVEGDLLRQDQAVRLAVDLEDLEPELAADERHQLLGDLLGRVARLVVLRTAREVDDLADRDEAADAAVDDEAALVVVDDRRLDDDARLELLLHRAPLALEAGAAQRQDDVALGRLGLEDVDEDRVADGQLRLALAVATEQLAVADDAFALGADVDEDLVLVDADDLALDDVTVLEALDVGVLLGEQLLHRRRLGSEVARRARAPRPRRRWRRARRRSRRRVRRVGVGRGRRRGGLDGARRRGPRRRSRLGVGGSATAARRRRRRPRRGSAARRRPAAAAAAAARLGGSSAAASAAAASAAARRPRLGVGASRASVLGGRRSSVLVAGSSATATAATVSSDAWSARRRWPPAPARSRPAALRSRVWSLLVVDLRPRITNGPSDAQAVSETIEVVRGDRLRGPLLRASNGLAVALQLSCLLGPGESSTRLLDGYNRRAVPELPDLTVVADALHAALAGRPVRSAEAPGPLAVRGTPAELAALVGQRVESIRRRGKFLLFELERDGSPSTRC